MWSTWKGQTDKETTEEGSINKMIVVHYRKFSFVKDISPPRNTNFLFVHNGRPKNCGES